PLFVRAFIFSFALLLVLPVMPGTSIRTASANSLADSLGLDPAYIPPDLGQTSLDVFVQETGHSIRGYMLDYWRANGAASVYGNPISEAFGASNGLYSQAFERGVFQFSPEWMWTDDPAVRLMPIGDQQVKEQRLNTRTDGRRTGADRRSAAWNPGQNSTDRVNEVTNEGGRFSDVTGFSISGSFGQWYDNHEGWFYMGAPISEPLQDRGAMVQYFQNGILMQQDGTVLPAPMPREHPEKYGFDTTPVAQDGRPEFSEALFYDTYNPYGVDVTQLTGRKQIVVSISEQTMYVYQGDTLVLQSLVSTGIEPNHTETGNFHVRLKYKTQTMSGFSDSTGEVVGLGDDSSNGGSPWTVEDVPNVMYFDYDAEALHGAYWHNNFGSPMSHGCVNQPLDVAAWMFEFAPIGTAVTVYQ
ncbi:MAG TPA: L,D-transpeptidase, partial [Thermomicrobiales bacterium]|nr:L,D-transpeptidase [Thermomicrobiales bacterium]